MFLYIISGLHLTAELIALQGCVKKIFDELQKHILVVVAVTVAMSILQISAVVSACLLARAVSTYA